MDTRPRLLGNRYELHGILASGGMGRVWRAHDTLLNRPVAVKILRSEYTGNSAFLARFRAEAQHAAALHHPNIAAVFDYGEIPDDDGEQLAYLVMELVEGDSLAALLDRERQLDVPRTLTIVRSTAAALAAAHAAGVVHRDVKPGNVLVARDGVVKITDFGIAWSASSVPLTQTGQVIGTAHYLSPEQAQGGKATPASDVYALGAVAYECLAGHRAFDGDSSVQIAVMQIRDEPAPLPPQIPSDVRQLVARAMAKNPAERFPDGAALRDAVDHLAAGRPAPTLPVAGAPFVAHPRSGAGHLPTAVLPTSQVGAVLAPAEGSTGTGRRALVRVALGGLVALVLLAVVIGVLQHSGGTATPAAAPGTATASGVAATSTSAVPTTSPAPRPVHLVAAGYLRRPKDQVQAALVALGLGVKLTPVTTRATGAGLVTAIAPVGDVPLGSTVTVTYAVAPPPAPAPAPAPQPAPKPERRPHKKHGKD